MPDLEMPRVIRSALSRAWRVVWAMLLAAVLLPAAGALGQATPPPARSFVWDQVDVTVELREDSSFHLTERNAVDFTGGPFRTGYREIPLAGVEGFDHVRVGEVEGAYVKPYRFVAPGEFPRETPNTYTWQEVGPNLRIEWSIPETTSETRTFQLEYDAFGSLRVYDDADAPYQQISWIGVDEVLTETAPVNEASLTFVLPRAIPLYTAIVQGSGDNRPTDHTDDGQTWVWQASDLGPGESLEASLRFPPLVTAEEPSWQDESDRAEAAETDEQAVNTPVPAGTPVASQIAFPPCREVMENDFPGQRRELQTNCITDRPIFVPEAWVFDGGGHTIYARDPDGGRFTGGVVEIPGPGSTVRNLTIDGEGLTAPCLVDGGATFLAGVFVTGATGEVSEVTVRNLNRPLPGSDETTLVADRKSCGMGINVFGAETGVTVDRNTVVNAGVAGIWVETGAASLANNTVARAPIGVMVTERGHVRISPGNQIRNGEVGIQIEGQGSGGRIAGNTIAAMSRLGISVILGARAAVADNSVEGVFHGIWVSTGSVATVSKNVVTDATEDGIVVTNGADASITENRVAGGERGIEVAGAGTTATITGNTLEEVGVAGITINQGATATAVSGNTVTGAQFGIVTLGAGTTSTITDNTVSDLRGSGFTVENGATAELRGNHVSDAGWGIIATAAGTTADLSENRIERTSTGGIAVNQGARATATGNTLLQPGRNGFQIDEAGHVTLEGNTIRDAGRVGMRLERTRAVSATGDSVELASRDIFYEPEEITIPTNTDVTLVLPNEGATSHNVTIEALGIDVDIAPGNTEEILVNAPAGTYEIHCNVPGHREAGQVATLTVTGAPQHTTSDDPVEPDVIHDNEITGGLYGIVGVGFGATMTVSNNTITGASEIGISIENGADATVEGNVIAEAGMRILLIRIGTSGTLVGNRIIDPAERGISIHSGAEATVRQNTVTQAGTNGIAVNGRGTSATLSGNAVSNATETGISVEAAASATIEAGNSVVGGKWGINILGDGTTAEVRGNQVRDADSQSITVLYGARATIADNTIHGGDSGIYIRYPRSRAIITGNTVAAERRGIYVWEGASAERIADNDIAQSDAGIVIEGEGVQAVVEGNRVQGSRSSSDAWGVFVAGQGTAATVSGNEISEIGGVGIQVGPSATGEVRDNRIDAVEQTGIRVLVASLPVVVAGNTLHEAGAIGIEARLNDATIQDNSIEGSSLAGIQLGVGANADVTGNTIVGPSTSGADDPGPDGIHIPRDASGLVADNRISGVVNQATGTGCAIRIDANAPDIRVADNHFPPPGNDRDVCDERLSAPATTPAPVATPIAAAPCLGPAELGPNVAVVATRTTILQKAPTDARPPRPIIARGTRLLVAPANTVSGSDAEEGACGWVPVVVVETGQPGFVPAEHVQHAAASDAAAP